MPTRSDKKSLFIILSVFLFVIIGTLTVSVIARGYRINFGQGPILKATGLLSATSRPKSASVYIDESLFTATDDTINLSPGNYLVKILKDGYLPWQKTINIKKEIVFQTNAELFRSVPELRPISLSGAINPALSPDLGKIVFAVATSSASKDNGLYLVGLADTLIPLARSTPRLLIANNATFDWAKAKYTFSPNSRQILASFPATYTNYLLSLDGPIDPLKLIDVTSRLSQIQLDWAQQETDIVTRRLSLLPPVLRDLVATASAVYVAPNSDEDKVLYLIAKNGSLPPNLISPPPAQSTQTQNRTLKKDHYYVYDLKDDTNFLLGPKSALESPFWLPFTNNVAYVESQSVKVCDYDGTNRQTIFSGIFNRHLVAPWVDSTKLITVTSPYTGAPENLYSISLK